MKITVCGCGWLGLPLAKVLHEQGHEVWGTKTSKEGVQLLKKENIHGVLLSLPLLKYVWTQSVYRALLACDVLVINIPCGRKQDKALQHIENVTSLLIAAKAYGCRRVIFVSTTSVYGDVQGRVVETSEPFPVTSSACANYQLEREVIKLWGSDAIILRLSGLISENRHPARFLANKRDLTQGGAGINLIHRDDVIQGVLAILDSQQHWGNTFHLASPWHPSREQYYTKMSLLMGLTPPHFLDVLGSEQKQIDASYTLKSLKLSLRYPFLLDDFSEV